MKKLLALLTAAIACTLNAAPPSIGQIGIPVWTANGTSTVWLTPQNNKVIGVNGSGNLEMVAGSGSSTLAGATDVAVTSVANLDVLQYNSTSGKWENEVLAMPFSSLTGVPTTLAGHGITDSITAALAASTYAPLLNPTFSGTATAEVLKAVDGLSELRVQGSGLLFYTGEFGEFSGTFALNTLTGNRSWLLPNASGTLLLANGNGSSLTALNASELTSGTVGTARLGTGTANSTTYLRGDGTWATVTGGVTSITGTANQITVTGTTTPTLSLPATITGLTSVTSTTFVGALTGTASGNLTSGGALGTPSSGTLTNCTGLPVSTGISGLGTGVATALAADTNGTSGLVTWASSPTFASVTMTGNSSFGSTLARFGGTTSSYSALKVSPWNNLRIAVRLADDSAYGYMNAAAFEVMNGTNRLLQFSATAGGGVVGLAMGSDARLVWTNVSSAAGDGGNGGNGDTGVTKVSAGVVGIGTGGAGSVAGTASMTNMLHAGYIEGTEMTAPTAPAANKGRVYFDDSGGKTRLMVIFPSGAAQQIAIEP